MNTQKSRRQFLKFMTGGPTSLVFRPWIFSGLFFGVGCKTSPTHRTFKGIAPSTKDQLLLAPSLKYNIIRRWGDPINQQGEVFGFNNDFTCFLPFNKKEGLLWVNHESIIPEFVHGKNTEELSRSKDEILKEQELVGGSILHIKKTDGKWTFQKNSKYNRRLHGRTPIPFSGHHKILGSRQALGTIANCAGGFTPWNTFLTSEENYHHFYGEAFIKNGKRYVETKKAFKRFQWYRHFPLPPEHYGWIVEVDPLTGKAQKQILLGRAPHEGATVVTTKNNQVVVYMGEDQIGGFIYKFVSRGLHFKKGDLYAADTVRGKWLPLDIHRSPILQKTFKSQLEVLTYAHQSAQALGATPQDRPEDIQVHKKTGNVFVVLTKNPRTNNKYGSILKMEEAEDHDSTEFKASTWISGGMDSGIACPDNLCFDGKDNLWVTVDVDEKKLGTKNYKKFGNNGLFFIPTRGPKAGQPIQMASAPRDAELTGPCFTPDYQTLFLSVQHPGSLSRKNMGKYTSDWPNGSGQMPRSAVVAIEGDLLKKMMSQ